MNDSPVGHRWAPLLPNTEPSLLILSQDTRHPLAVLLLLVRECRAHPRTICLVARFAVIALQTKVLAIGRTPAVVEHSKDRDERTGSHSRLYESRSSAQIVFGDRKCHDVK